VDNWNYNLRFDPFPDISSSVFATLGFNVIFAQAGGPVQSAAPSLSIVKILIIVNPAGMPSSFNTREIAQKLQAQMAANVFNNLASGSVQIKVIAGNIDLPPGWTGSPRRQYINLVHWTTKTLPLDAMATSNGKGETQINMNSVNTYFADTSFNVNSQFFANLLAHEVFWLNTGGHSDLNPKHGGEIQSGKPTYRHDAFDVDPDSRQTILSDFGFKAK
jgi:hypothetical protein